MLPSHDTYFKTAQQLVLWVLLFHRSASLCGLTPEPKRVTIHHRVPGLSSRVPQSLITKKHAFITSWKLSGKSTRPLGRGFRKSAQDFTRKKNTGVRCPCEGQRN